MSSSYNASHLGFDTQTFGMRKQFALFYHVWCPSENTLSLLLIDEQLKRIARSGLPNYAHILCCVTGAAHAYAASLIEQYSWVSIIASDPSSDKFEGATLERLHDLCAVADWLLGVAYVHTKGMRVMTEPLESRCFKSVNSWRHFLEWGVLDRWRDAVRELVSSNVVGVNYRLDPWPHFGGNFWWAQPSYIRTLIRPEIGKFPAGNYGFVVQEGTNRAKVTQRLDFERWICLNCPKAFSFYGYPFYADGIALPSEFHNLYENDIEPFYRVQSV